MLQIFVDASTKLCRLKHSTWAYIFYQDNKIIRSNYGTTVRGNNHAELYAVIQALKNLADQETAIIYTDSLYVMHIIENINCKNRFPRLDELFDLLNTKKAMIVKIGKGSHISDPELIQRHREAHNLARR